MDNKGGRGMKITDALLGEHGVFYAQFTHLEQVLPHTETVGEVHAQAALLAAALATHARLEEDVLFPSLDPHLGPMGPLAVMRAEHNEIEGTLSRIPNVDDLVEARGLLVHALQVARQHFAKEEQVLFPMAGQILGEETLTQLGAQWAERRSVSVL
ncbi:MAG: hemerythrin domain-containing protein [Armatimonadota bacterium]|nr:hemerythrin domain-containing protein [Armatimonadota bacterium]